MHGGNGTPVCYTTPVCRTIDLRVGGAGGRGSAAQAFDLFSAGRELRLQLLEAAIEVIHAVHERLTFGSKIGDHQHLPRSAGRAGKPATVATDHL